MNQDMLLQEILPPLKAAYETIAAAVFSPSVTYQVAWLFVSLVGGLMLSRYPTRWCDTFITQRNPHAWVVSLLNAFRAIILPLITLLFLGLYLAVGLKLSLSGNIISIAANLASVWIVIRFSSSFVRKPWLAKWIAILAMAAATLNILGLLDTVITQLEAIGFQLGKTRISIFGILKSLLFLFLFLWGANMLSGTLERKIQSISEFTPSLRVLLAKLFRITLVTIAILFGLNTLGIDLTAFAVFSGAVGVGLGFGLQKVVSNFISGIILLMDRSIKPGDVVVVDNTFGWVNSLHARYVSVITRDGKEHLIPNELLITEKVENWSYSSDNIRLRIPIGISYHSDPRKAIELVKEAAAAVPRILKHPEPVCNVTGFGESSVDLELRVWIRDPSNGIGNVKSQIFLEIWDRFHKNGIEIPFPQLDIHMREHKANA